MAVDLRALVSLARVKSYIGIDVADTTWDGQLEPLIDAVSQDFHRIANREFVSIDADGSDPVPLATRVFDVDYDTVRSRELYVGDMQPTGAELVIELKDVAGTVQETVGVDTVALIPRVREPWQPVHTIRFLAGLPGSATLARGHTAAVTARWGFPELPEGLVQAAVERVWMKFLQDIRRFGEVFEEDAGRPPPPSFAAIQATLRGYRLPGMG